MILELTIGVPMWNVVRFISLSLVTKTVLSKLWSSSVAFKAGSRVAAGIAIELKPRPYTRSSLVTEEDSRDRIFKILLWTVTVMLTAADLLMEFGSGSAEVSTSRVLNTGYENATELQPLEIRKSGGGRWTPALAADRKIKTSYRVYELENLEGNSLGVTSQDLGILQNTRNAGESGGQMLTAATPNEWVLASRGENIWFAGNAGAALLKGRKVIFTNGAQVYKFVLEETEWRGEPSPAVIEMVSHSYLFRNFQAYSYSGAIVTDELRERPQLALDCTNTPEYPSSWEVACVDAGVRPSEVLKHDRDPPEPERALLVRHDLRVDFGVRVGIEMPWAEFKRASSRPVSSTSGRVSNEVLWGEKSTLVLTQTAGVLLHRSGPRVDICLSIMGDTNNGGRPVCRGRTWDSTEEVVATRKRRKS